MARATTSTLNGREVIVAIVGGTMLTLALTRPHLRWVERLTEGSMRTRLWAERVLTFFSFVMAGYAATAVVLVLHKQINPELDALLNGTAWFLVIYAWLVHLEPFSNEWNLRGGVGACILYTTVAVFAVTVGFAVAAVVLKTSAQVPLGLLGMATGTMAVGWVLYRFGADLMAALERGLGFEPEHPKTSKTSGNPDSPPMETSNTASVTVTSGPTTRTRARSTRA